MSSNFHVKHNSIIWSGVSFSPFLIFIKADLLFEYIFFPWHMCGNGLFIYVFIVLTRLKIATRQQKYKGSCVSLRHPYISIGRNKWNGAAILHSYLS